MVQCRVCKWAMILKRFYDPRDPGSERFIWACEECGHVMDPIYSQRVVKGGYKNGKH